MVIVDRHRPAARAAADEELTAHRNISSSIVGYEFHAGKFTFSVIADDRR
jgi:hypothetical protein